MAKLFVKLNLTGLVVVRMAGLMRSQERSAQRERELTEEIARRRGEARFASLVQNSTDLITKHTALGVVTYASPVSASMLGTPHTSLVGHSFLEFVHPDDYAAVRAVFDRLMKGSAARVSPTSE